MLQPVSHTELLVPLQKPHPPSFLSDVHKTLPIKHQKLCCPIPCYIVFRTEALPFWRIKASSIEALRSLNHWGLTSLTTGKEAQTTKQHITRNSPTPTPRQAFIHLLSNIAFSPRYFPPVLHLSPSPHFQTIHPHVDDTAPHNQDSDHESSQMFLFLLYGDCGHLWGPLLHILCTHMEDFTPGRKQKETLGVWATRDHRIECWTMEEFAFFFLLFATYKKKMERYAHKDDILPPACVLHYTPPPITFFPLFSLARRATWYALIHDHCDDKHEKDIHVITF